MEFIESRENRVQICVQKSANPMDLHFVAERASLTYIVKKYCKVVNS